MNEILFCATGNHILGFGLGMLIGWIVITFLVWLLKKVYNIITDR